MGMPLPDTYRVLAGKKAHFRRGATSMIAGQPGAFKSTLALNICSDWAMKGLSGLFISADSDQHTVGKRCAAIVSGDSVAKIEPVIKSGGYNDDLVKISDIHWEYKQMNLDQIDIRIRAHVAMYGKPPDFIVLDNLMNMVDNPADFQGQIRMTRDLDVIARRAGAHVMILHHTREIGAASHPPPRWEIQGKVSQFPRMILTLHCSPGGVNRNLMVAVVKNTNGPQDPSGEDYSDFIINTDNCRVDELEFT
jgi:predicted ATP-dependent serine protease